MNLNLTAYFIFISSMIFIIVWVGRRFYNNGRVFILALLNGDEPMTDQINHLLLLGYYLFNIGYSFLQLHQWERVTSAQMLMAGTAHKMGMLIFLLAMMHYGNMAVIYLISKTRTFSKSNKTFQS